MTARQSKRRRLIWTGSIIGVSPWLFLLTIIALADLVAPI
jgi:hypothetical protein